MPSYPAALETATRDEGRGRTAALGRRVRALRKAAGLTLEQAGAATGISRAALSKIERGEMSPTYDSLCKLAEGLRIDLAALVSGRAQAGGGLVVTRAGEGAVHDTERFAHRLLAPEFPSRRLYVFETGVEARGLDAYDAWDRHESEDFLYVLAGEVRVHLEGHEPVELGVGDGLQMDGRIPHALVAVAAPARLLWMSVPLGS